MQDLRSLIDRINSEDEQRAVENFRFAEEQKIKKALGPRLWEDLKNNLSEQCAAIGQSSSRKLNVAKEGINRFSFTDRKSGRTALLTYNSDVPCVFYQASSLKGEFTYRVSSDGNSLDFLIDGIPHRVEEIALFLIRHIIS
jgi:hypothetical protein